MARRVVLRLADAVSFCFVDRPKQSKQPHIFAARCPCQCSPDLLQSYGHRPPCVIRAAERFPCHGCHFAKAQTSTPGTAQAASPDVHSEGASCTCAMLHHCGIDQRCESGTWERPNAAERPLAIDRGGAACRRRSCLALWNQTTEVGCRSLTASSTCGRAAHA
jgi:hypothetical protein